MTNNKSKFMAIILMSFVFVITPSVFSLEGAGNAGEYFIAGISTKEDIGGVEISTNGAFNTSDAVNIIFENYNNFIVSVIFEYETGGVGGARQTGAIVLKPNEKKTTTTQYWKPGNFKLIVRKTKT
jgi:hypothetical protein